MNSSDLKITKIAPGLVEWTSDQITDGIGIQIKSYMEFDGYVRFNIKVHSKNEIEVKDIRLISAYSEYASKYFMGIGYEGGLSPEELIWDWNGPYDSFWVGNELVGAHFEFRGGSYHGPLLNDYKPSPSPVWSNNSLGRIFVKKENEKIKVIASTGKKRIGKEDLDFEFAILLTPVHEVKTAKHFSERYFHADPADFNQASLEHANIANIHHARSLNPVINYPFIVQDSLIAFIQEQHAKNNKVKLYYTVREVTNYVKEIHALHSLNHEIFNSGPGYGIPWLQEHLIEDYRPAWYTELPEEKSDAALVLNSFSRWINYYLEGLKWMLVNYEIDGIYMDDVSFDRNVMKRIRKIFDRYRPGALIDLHSNTGYSKGPMNQYADFFPYIDRLWFGENFEYDKMDQDQWYVTFSGIPFGLMSEMLQDGGNRYLGMLYGATARHSYGPYSPAPIWSLWDSFGIDQAQMIGYWDENCPVKADQDQVKATVYKREKSVLVAIGNFSEEQSDVRFSIDWDMLGLDPDKVKIYFPVIKDFQEADNYDLKRSLRIKPKEGKIIIITQNDMG
ncbi:MAG: glycoside hydrolase domain-containing protein [Bacteroidales bacterium]